ncbi:MAG: DNA-protecting protein DprA [Planctomycetaceae bacterium]|nr:DNA-protecting protein DprA [Planctomycetaceae bacterium]
MQRDAELDARLRLAMVSGLGPVLTRRLEKTLGGPANVASASTRDLKQTEGIGPKLADQIRRGLDDADVDAEWALVDQHHVRLVGLADDEYPALLEHIHDPPPLLYVRGRIERNDALALGIVGARRCTQYGREQADRLAAVCAQAGLCIISGGARGIDTASHRAALRAAGRTIAVLGSGLANVYPAENAELFDQIADDHGAVITELPMTAAPVAENFPRRNRIISGMSLGILVVEASARSGALITARLAAEEHHREVMCLPGRVDSPLSDGCHKMIREGWAQLVTNAADILDGLGDAGQSLRAALEPHDNDDNDDRDIPDASPSIDAAGLTDSQQALLNAIEPDPTPIDALPQRSGLDIAAVQSHLTVLQLTGRIERLPGNRVRRRR